MSIYKAHKNQNYSVVDNRILTELSLSHEARFLLLYMLSKPADWNFVNWHILQETGLTEYKFKALMKELKSQGYVEKDRKQVQGKYIWTTHVYEEKRVNSIGSISTDSNSIDSISTDKLSNRITKQEIKKHEINSSSEEKKARKRNEFIDAFIVGLIGVSEDGSPKVATGSFCSAAQKALKEIREVEPELTVEKLRGEIKAISAKYDKVSPMGISKWWGQHTQKAIKPKEDLSAEQRRNLRFTILSQNLDYYFLGYTVDPKVKDIIPKIVNYALEHSIDLPDLMINKEKLLSIYEQVK